MISCAWPDHFSYFHSYSYSIASYIAFNLSYDDDLFKIINETWQYQNDHVILGMP